MKYNLSFPDGSVFFLFFFRFEMSGISPRHYGYSHGIIHIHASKLGSLEFTQERCKQCK